MLNNHYLILFYILISLQSIKIPLHFNSKKQVQIEEKMMYPFPCRGLTAISKRDFDIVFGKLKLPLRVVECLKCGAIYS
jgi:uncharacterized protein YjfI (DUF2170 family)